jgi:ATP-binding cassette subfamily F protein 3
MVPSIRNILGGFLFTEDDVHKHVKVLSGGERTRLAVARMLLRPSNTLLLDEPTNHLDIDSTNVLLEALADYGGTLIFVSHDRYFVDRLATKIIEVGDGNTVIYPGTYEEFRWSKAQQLEQISPTKLKQKKKSPITDDHSAPKRAADHKRNQIESRRHKRIIEARQKRITELEKRIADCETTIRTLETEMSDPDFYTDKAAAEETIKRHQTFMWKVGDLMNQWEALEAEGANETNVAEDTAKA